MGLKLRCSETSNRTTIMISVILPTYNEVGNIKAIVTRISQVLGENNIEGEIIVVDDNSPDGTAEAARELAREYPLRLHVRNNERGLASAVMKGFELAKGDICVVMDADLSHPVEKIPDLVWPIFNGKCDVTVGSRYVSGGGTQNWPLVRKLASKGAGLLAKSLTRLSDPTSGFMAARKSILESVSLEPIGWKIVLEVIVKANPRFMEVPIVFVDRYKGESKINSEAQLDYLRHIFKLYCFRYANMFQFMKFCCVGLSGLFVDTVVLISVVELFSIDPRPAAIVAFVGAVSWNYALNSQWTFKHARELKSLWRYPNFVTVCIMGLGIRIGVMHMLIEFAWMSTGLWYVMASLIGIGAGTAFNFLGSKLVVFSAKTFADD